MFGAGVSKHLMPLALTRGGGADTAGRAAAAAAGDGGDDDDDDELRCEVEVSGAVTG